MSPTARAFAAAALACVVVLLGADPAAAHGAGGSDATSYLSEVREVPDERVRWTVVAGDSLLEATNDSGRELVVLGYLGEPYLRFTPGDGVFENRRSPAAYLNEDRYAETGLPDDVDAGAPPAWSQVADGDRYAWHDHRIHWMDRQDPPAVAADRSRVHTVFDWEIPYVLDGTDGERRVTGTLRWVPPPPWWPWVLGAAALALVPLVVAARSRPTGGRWPALAKPVLVVLGVVVAANVVHAVDDLVAVPATTAEHLVAGGTSAVVLGLAGYCLWRGRRGDAAGFAALAIGSLVLLFGQGLPHRAALGASQLATSLPDGFTRGVVAASLVAALPGVAAAVLAERSFGTFFGRLDPQGRVAEET